MATLKTNTLTGTSTAGSIAVTGEGNSTTTNLQQGLVKAWCKFNGEASSIANDDSFNVSGLTDHGTGQYTITIDNDMAMMTMHTLVMVQNKFFPLNALNTLTGSVRVYSKNLSDSHIDAQEVSVQITGDLA